jgi:hypothetical protein
MWSSFKQGGIIVSYKYTSTRNGMAQIREFFNNYSMFIYKSLSTTPFFGVQ